MTKEVAVVGCGAFVPGFDGLAGWVRGEASADHDLPQAEIVPKRQRRRASPLSKAVSDAYAEALAASNFEPDSVASVFGSAIGEASTMIGLLDQLWGDAAMLSPMRFATSVHNAASGMLSIATENRGITTAMGADYDTPAMALLEGIGLVLARGESVIVCCGDEAPPEDLIPDGVGWSLMTAAIALCPSSEAPASSPRLSDLTIASGDPLPSRMAVPSAMQEELSRNPSIGLLDLVVAIERGTKGVCPLDRGAGRGYSIRLHGSAG
jgi:hypothetical protein